jgi:hypothetical protein
MAESNEALIERIFHPYAMEQMEAFAKRGDGQVSFVHYTSAKAALGIIKSKRVWMRNVTGMSDYSEVLHGQSLLRSVLYDDGEKGLRALTDAVDACVPAAAPEAILLFNRLWDDIRSNTYVTCISEHRKDEDEHGRLSMWRAFGGTEVRVALVFKFPYSLMRGNVFNLVISPVAYLGKQQLRTEFDRVVSNIRHYREFIKSIGRERVVTALYNMLVAGVTCLKHEGFKEECEWRLIYAPVRWPSPLIAQERSTEEINGIPQVIYKIPLDAGTASAPDGLKQLDFAQLFDRLIIGPTVYPYSMLEAFVTELQKLECQSLESCCLGYQSGCSCSFKRAERRWFFPAS